MQKVLDRTEDTDIVENTIQFCTENSVRKGVWSTLALKILCAVFFSYLATFPFYIINYIRLNHPKKVFRIKCLTAAVVVYLFFILVISDTLWISPVFIMYNIILGVFISNDQKPFYQEYIQNGGKKNSTLLLVFLALSTFLVVLSILVFISFLFYRF